MGLAEKPLLIVRLGAMGDVLHALPAVAMLRRALPEARIGWVVERRWRELLCAPSTELCGPRSAGRPLVDSVHLVDTRGWRRDPFSRATRNNVRLAIAGMRAEEYQAALDLQGAMKSSVIAWLAKPHEITGFRHPREKLARMFYSTTTDTTARHVIEQNIELAQSWLIATGLGRATAALSPGTALLPRDPQSEEHLEAILHVAHVTSDPLAILNPGAGWGAKQWPVERYGELAAQLAQRGVRSIVNYGPGEEKLARRVVEESRGSAVELRTSLGELMALCRRARLFVGGDTGPMHLAALLGIRTIALFGPTDPARNGPFWAGTRVLRDEASVTDYSHSRQNDAGLERITVKAVLDEALAVLD